MNDDTFDVIIIGSGPAGCSTALHLNKIAPELVSRTLVLEKARHPRPKLCGGGVVIDAERILQGLGLTIDSIPHCRAEWAHVLYEGRGLRMKLGDMAFKVVRRNIFDAWLATNVRSAGFRLEEEVTVRDVRPTEEFVEVDTNKGPVRSRVVVGADGTLGVTRNAVARRTSHGIARAVEVLLDVPRACGGSGPHLESEAVFEFGITHQEVQGFFWSFPCEESGARVRNCGVFDARITNARSSGSLKPCLAAAVAASGSTFLEQKLQGYPVRWLDHAFPLSINGVLLVGDAAGVDPVFGEGISQAMGYGELAASEICKAFSNNDFRFSSYDVRVRNSALGKNLQRRLVIAKILYTIRKPFLMRLLFHTGAPIVERVLKKHVFNWYGATS